jgi:hypothetical protein
VILSLLSACSSSQPLNTSPRNLSVEAVEKVSFGKTQGPELVKLIGQPSRIVHLKREFQDCDAWVYSEQSGGQDFERLSFLVDQKTGLVESATWAVKVGDELSLLSSTFAHFKNAKFSNNELGWVARDYYSEDTVYDDPQLGIVLYVDGVSHKVKSISFAFPTPKKLAENKK